MKIAYRSTALLPKEKRVTSNSVWAFLAGGVLIFFVVFPLARGMVAASDDIALLSVHFSGKGAWRAVADAWADRLFRPLAQVSAFLTDPFHRSAGLVAVASVLLVFLTIPAVGKLARRTEAILPRYAHLPALLWLLHSSTSVSLWQMDTLSQTASACVGLWLLALSTDAWTPKLNRSLVWITLCSLGLLTKETFLGWVLMSAGIEALWTRGTKLGNRSGAVAGSALATAFVLARLFMIGTAVADGNENYALHLEASTVTRNLATILLGLLSCGSIHAFRTLTPYDLHWWPAVIGSSAQALVLMLAIIRSPAARFKILGTGFVALGITTPFLFLGHVSELYLMGPNALGAIAAVVAFSAVDANTPKWIHSLALVAVLTAGVSGIVTRAVQFDITWQYSRELSSQVERMARGSLLSTGPTHSCEKMAMRTHSTYLVPPLHALGPEATAALYALNGSPLPEDWKNHLDCSILPERPRW